LFFKSQNLGDCLGTGAMYGDRLTTSKD
jgi:hypothetical protein